MSKQRLISDLVFKAGGNALKLFPLINKVNEGPFAPVPAGATVLVEHGLRESRPVRPTSVLPDRLTPLIVASADESVVKIVNTDLSNAQEATFRCVREHSIHESALLADPGGSAQPPLTQLIWKKGNAPIQVPYQQSTQVHRIYARSTGSDTTGDGTLANPYRTFARAIQDVPLILNGTDIWIVDISGIGTETLPESFLFPPIQSPFPFVFDISMHPYLQTVSSVNIFAEPTVIDTISPAEFIAAIGDPVTGLKTLSTTKTFPPSHVGKQIIDASGNIGVIAKVTGGDLEVTGVASYMAPFQIVAPSAELIPSSSVFEGGPALSINNTCSISIGGVSFRHVPFFADGTSLSILTSNALTLVGCHIEGIEIIGTLTSGIVSNANFIYGSNAFLGIESIDVSSVADLWLGPLSSFQMGVGGCELVLLQSIVDGISLQKVNTPTSFSLRVSNTLIRNAPYSAIDVMNFGRVAVKDTRINASVGDAIFLDGVGAELVNVQGSGNGGFGVRITNGSQVKRLSGTAVTGTSGDYKVGGLAAGTWGTFPANANDSTTFSRMF